MSDVTFGSPMRMLDLFCGRFGWGKTFATRGWEVVGVDILEPAEIPQGCSFWEMDIMQIDSLDHHPPFDFICASPPCQEFSKFGMPNFYPEPKYPSSGVRLFNHTRELCEASGIPYIIENVWGAQKFVGDATGRCGPFFVWGNGVPPITPQGIQKGGRLGTGGWQHTGSKNKAANAALVATIPPELANCVADYAERILERKTENV